RGDWFGYSIANLGDLDGDGVPDHAIGNPLCFYDDSAERVWIYSGADGRVLFEVTGAPSGFEFWFTKVANGLGAWIVPVGDQDGDGVGELALYAGCGRVEVRSGRDLHTFATIACPRWSTQDLHRRPIAGMEDVDGDGFADLAVGSSIVSARDGRVLVTLDTDASKTFCPHPLERVGDFDGDCLDDVAIGFPEDEPGHVQVCSSRTGKRVLWIAGRSWRDRDDPEVAAAAAHSQGDPTFELGFGQAFGDVGDLNDDGQRDLFVGSLDERPTSPWCYLHSGTTGAVLSTVHSDHGPAHQPFAPADLDGDGRPDLVMTSVMWTADVMALKDSSAAQRFESDLGVYNDWGTWGLVVTVESAGDIDRDGVPDLLAGVLQYASPGLPGYVVLLSGRDGHTLRIYDTASSLAKIGSRR
ncbi:MAG: FG-GAP-like repeat-containing protein, partial [Planctomycetes bacterium]|nr:FG-GAP-like repeat-containing protein [Planctomycetota bacterium]